MIILRLLLLLINLHLILLSTQGTGADKLLSTQRVKSCMRRLTISTVILIFDCLGACLSVNLGISSRDSFV